MSVCHGNGYDNVDIFGLGGIDLLRCCCRARTRLATENTYTTHCCEQVRHATDAQYSIKELHTADLYRWSWGRWMVSESALYCEGYLKVEQQAHWLLIQQGPIGCAL